MTGCCLRIKEAMQSLAPMERKVAGFILDFPEEVVNMSIDELAASCSTSTASVVRLCKSVGYSGYKEFCRVLDSDLANQQGNIVYEEIHPGDSLEAIVSSVSKSDMKAIEGTLSLVDMAELGKAVDALCAAPRIDFYGVGTSGLVALDASNKFIRINKFTVAHADPHEQILSATSLRPGDVAVLFSYSGETRDTTETCEIVKATGATIITVTRYGKNQLNELADIRLFTSSAESMIRSGAMGSRIGQLTMVDILYTAVCSRLYGDVKPYLDKTRLTSQRKRSRPRK
ncbi:MAG TPA: MurR/RpiR family transcriptional regulator [Rectinemataceae bacterium]|nr:MurR/RpiR family transcriptional regulator [Rectinemataceae bacterium]